MKTSLMHIPRDSKIYLDEGNTLFMDDGREYKDDQVYIHFGHLDGMYSYCTIMAMDGDPMKQKDGHNALIHLSVGTPLEQYKDGYRLTKEAQS